MSGTDPKRSLVGVSARDLASPCARSGDSGSGVMRADEEQYGGNRHHGMGMEARRLVWFYSAVCCSTTRVPSPPPAACSSMRTTPDPGQENQRLHGASQITHTLRSSNPTLSLCLHVTSHPPHSTRKRDACPSRTQPHRARDLVSSQEPSCTGLPATARYSTLWAPHPPRWCSILHPPR